MILLNDDMADKKLPIFFLNLNRYLQETYGVIVYQEQVMKIASLLAVIHLGEADILRRAMGKKKAEVMAEQRAIFVERATARNFDAKKAGELFDLMAYFAGYGFNKSHSAAYALIAYQTAYLKANYPAEFMACLISLEASNAEKMAFYLQEAKDMGLEILPPDINQSDIDFIVVNDDIIVRTTRYKKCWPCCHLKILSANEHKGPFTRSFMIFATRIDLRTSNKRVIENLICAGAFDPLPATALKRLMNLPKLWN